MRPASSEESAFFRAISPRNETLSAIFNAMIRTIIGVSFLTLFILIAGLPVIAFSALTGSSDVLYRLGKWGIGVSMRLAGVRVRVEGLENIPAGVCVFAANHVSNLDPPAALIGVPRRISFLAKKEVFKVPIVRTALRLGKIVPVDREHTEAAISSIDHAVGILLEGISFFVFPEGTRSKDGRMKPFKKGTFIMAIQARAPVVPVSILGSRERMRKGSLSTVPGEILLRFGAPIATTSYTVDQRDQLLERVQSAVAAGLQQAPR
ncbi:MAG TPA: lysophospholipid acyltransferase family protein [Candidatus Acidoferrales bacterium]|nr:lysophospholipid acyltransferase family protein [Candidatus Acidoferrales bacterium]